MGCDIHIFHEYFNKEKYCWVFDGEVNLNQDYLEFEDITAKFAPAPNYRGGYRNYTMFSILSDVRGTATEYGFQNRISEEGLPYDVTEGVKCYFRSWGGDLHSHSHITLENLKSVNISKKFTQAGIVSIEEYEACKKENRNPEQWCRGTSSRTVTTKEYEKEKESLKGQQVRINMSWEDQIDDYCSELPKIIKYMESLAKKHNLKDHEVRMVFGYDN